MDTTQIRRHVARVFPRSGSRTTRVGVEHELLTADRDTGAAVPIKRIREATRHGAYAAHLGFEPGGQVELSLPCSPDPTSAARFLHEAVTALHADCAAAGIRVDDTPVDPRPACDVPLQLTSPRYVAMQRRFDGIGPAGRRMMRRTASTQLCLDWWPGEAGLEQWRLLNLAGPFLAAAYARSTGPDSRLATWLAVDPSRTAFDDSLVRGDDPVAAYADFAVRAAVFTTGGIDEHLTTLFPPVRPRGRYLEVRFLDVQPLREVEPLATTLSTLLYDDTCRRRAGQIVGEEVSQLAGLWHRAAVGDLEVRERGRELVALALTAPRLDGAA